MNAERERIASFGRLENGLHQAGDWYIWGPYVTERQWGTVREDDSAGAAGRPGARRDQSHLQKLAARLFDEGEFLSPYGLRALSAYHRDHPYVLDVEGRMSTIDYEPAESTTAMFGGNSNWRGPLRHGAVPSIDDVLATIDPGPHL